MPTSFPLDVLALTKALVAMDTRNPSLVPDAPGESECAAFLAGVLDEWGCATVLEAVAPGRHNVIARIGPPGKDPLILNGHLDVVGVDGMTHSPFIPHEHEGSVYGRGTTDMKGGIAAMCVAAASAALENRLHREVIITAVCDEEFASIGTRHLLANGLRANGAIITEPTRLAVVPAHKGFVWIEVALTGRAAHGSRYDVGIDANRQAAHLLVALDRFERDVLATRTHPLLGRSSLHAPMISGGTGWSTYADSCTVRIERRTLPGETDLQVIHEVRALIEELQGQDVHFTATASIECAQPPLAMASDAPLVSAMVRACQSQQLEGRISGLSCWTDAALFAEAGIPAICFGPGDIARAHSATEWVEIEQLRAAERALSQLISTDTIFTDTHSTKA
ncbi:MAG: ArgE/DapE family deacylase [Gemmatimonadaceae bacterium]|nr:ArgE/DapE family deacylase [Gemmatimonadaceae bacterium]